MPNVEEVDFVSGKTRMFGIVGHPIEQVRSPEMITAEFHKRGADALMLPFHVRPEDFEPVLPALLRIQNLDGLVFTIPFKATAVSLAQSLGPQAQVVGAINALAKGRDGRWQGEIFDGSGCVEAFRRRGFGFRGKHVMLIGAGGAGTAIGVAIAFESPASIRLHDPDESRIRALAASIAKVDPAIAIEIGSPSIEGMDILLNASPVGMLSDARLPMNAVTLPQSLIVFDAIVKPERTPLLDLAERCGCTTVYGREMMRGQISTMVDYFGFPRAL